MRPNQGTTTGMPPLVRYLLFERLPFDIHYQIASYLDYVDILKLSSVNSISRDYLNNCALVPKRQWIQFLCETERHSSRNSLRGFGRQWPCYGCGRVLDKASFGDRMKRYEKWRFRKSITLRRCWDCAVRERWYGHLQPIKKKGEVFRLCWRCGRLWNEREEERCRKVDVLIKIDGVHREKDTGWKCKATVCGVQMESQTERLTITWFGDEEGSTPEE
ncbi:hypothetical protein BDP55DRAFT_663633 [Colletotrichum godetiae]|uniref:F-box domain-containing protein n=1 Tax=Colletotrichum godetiae TaxID=1209918 RepID=A0AAJ0ANM4_9PEZI|nr:uncharacterized protein BDP55DRAFT_663633 [Colletotrichum godetiae]KAK1675748.1 hypothetical protein BDP55DRAFT_663633 [Colletotrichum godetiae]